jgi:hypothetical protein
MKRLKQIPFIDIILIISPIVDVLICMLQKFTHISIISALLRGSLLIGLLIYVLIQKKKYDKKIIRYIMALFLYAIVFMFSTFLVSKSTLIKEAMALIKYFFYPLATASLLLLNNKEDKNIYSTLYICALIYGAFLLFPMLLNLNFRSYNSVKVGNVGWFYSPNEISSIVGILAPFVIIKIFSVKTIKEKIMQVLIASLYIYTIFTIGTKTVILSVFISLLFILIKNVYDYIKKHKEKINLLSTVLLIAFTLFCFANSSSLANIRVQSSSYDQLDIAKRDANVVSKDAINSYAENYYRLMYDFRDEPMYITNKYLNLIFSSRDVFLMEHINSFKKASMQEKLFGMGQVYNERDAATSKLIEIDFFDIFFNYGIVGFVIYYSFIVYLLFTLARYLFKNLKKVIEDVGLYAAYISAIITTLLSCLAGHVLGAPAVSLIAAIIISLIAKKGYELKLENKNIFNKSFIIKTLGILAVALIIVVGFNRISKIERISNTLNINIEDGSLLINDSEYSLKKNDSLTIKSEFARDELIYYDVIYKEKDIINLIVVNRTFNNSDIKYNFIVGKNNAQDNVMIKINNLDSIKDKSYVKAMVYDLANVNYDGINHSIVKDLNKTFDFSSTNEFVVGDKQYFDMNILYNIYNEYNKDNLNELFTNSWLSFDGRYIKTDVETTPSAKHGYVRNSYNDIEYTILNKYQETNDKVLESLVNSYMHLLIMYLPRYEDGVWLKEYTGNELRKSGVYSLYVDVLENIKIDNYLKQFDPNNNYKLHELLAKYLLQQDKMKYYLVNEDVRVPLDFYSNALSVSYSSLSTELSIIDYLLTSSKKEYQQIAITYLNNLTLDWIREDGNLYVRINSDFEYEGEDKGTEIFDKLLMVQSTLIRKTGIKSPKITELIKSKIKYLNNSNQQIDSELLNRLKVGGYIE